MGGSPLLQFYENQQDQNYRNALLQLNQRNQALQQQQMQMQLENERRSLAAQALIGGQLANALRGGAASPGSGVPFGGMGQQVQPSQPQQPPMPAPGMPGASAGNANPGMTLPASPLPGILFPAQGVQPSGNMVPGGALPLAALQQTVLGLEGNQDYGVGKAGELGPGQIKPSTGAEYGFKPDQLFGNAGRQASATIVDDLYKQSGGDPAATLVGYNAGPGAMQKFERAGDDPNAVKLAPAYRKAVFNELSDDQQQQASDIAISAAGRLPPMMVGNVQPTLMQRLVQQVAGADADDDVKGAALMTLLPLMSQDGQRQFQQMFDMLQLQERQYDRDAQMAQTRELAEERMNETRLLTEARLQQSGDIAQQKIGLEAQKAGASQQLGQQRLDLAKQKFNQAQQGGGPESVDTTAKAIANYQIAPLTGWTLRGPWGQAVMSKVLQYNPEYQATQYAGRLSATRAFASGRQSDTVRSMSVAIDHLDTAQRLGEALQNSDTPGLNKVKNELKTQFGYDGPVDFNTAKMIVADEVTKAVAGGVLSMGERLEMGNQLSAASSPEQLAGVISTLKRLLGGQLGGLERQFETGTGQSKEKFQEKLSPKARQQLEGNQSQSGGDVVPVPPAFANDPDGTAYQKDDGTWVKKGDKLVKTPGAVPTNGGQ
jgi:hypothetical protein